jgi:hypothetical protein
MSPPVSRNVARRLLTYEAAPGKNSEPTESAAFRVLQKLRPPLCSLAGIAGFRSLLSRALVLARAEAPSLNAVRVGGDGYLTGMDALGPQNDEELFREGGAILITQLLGLLLTFVGEGITLRLIQDVWPESTFDDRDSRKEMNV